MATLFDPVTVGDLKLANRVVMAPLTRNRSPRAVPNDLNVTYYEQRASAGLIITEATPISHQGQGYADVPGLYSAEQLAGWKRVTDAVHTAGGKIVVQMWHVGRISHNTLQPNGGKPVALRRSLPSRRPIWFIPRHRRIRADLRAARAGKERDCRHRRYLCQGCQGCD